MEGLNRPNVLMIYTDQQRFDSLRCYGNKIARTPHLDKLAREGVLFEHHYVQNPVCMPSRMSMLTSQYPGQLGIGTNGIPLPEGELLLHQVLKPYGYHTANIGKLHFTPHVSREHRDPYPGYGFDTLINSDEPGCYDDAYTKWVEGQDRAMLAKIRTSLPPAAVNYHHPAYSNVPRETHQPYLFEGDESFTHSAFVTTEICQFLEQHQGERFFAVAGFYAPHPPLNPPQKFVDLYDLDQIPLPKMGLHDQPLPFLQDVAPADWKKVIAYYLALVSHVDQCVGKILNKLEQLGLAEHTLIVFTSDHGEYLGDHGRIQKGWPGHDVIIRVPLIMRYPGGISSRKVVSNLVEAVDIAPTILDYCGIQQPGSFQGMSLRGLIEERTTEHKDVIITDMFNPTGYRGTTIRTTRYKYYSDTEGNQILYDLKQDPDEFYNLVSDRQYQDILSEMRWRMMIKLQESGYRNRNKTAEY